MPLRVPLSGGWVDPTTGAAEIDGRPRALTPRERDLLRVLLAHPGETLAREVLMERVWGEGHRNPQVVDVTLLRLRAKIERDPAKPEHLVTRRGEGYRLDLPEDPAALDLGDAIVDPTERVWRTDAAAVPLSPEEVRLLRALAAAAGALVDRDALRLAVWGPGRRAPRDVDSLVAGLRRKVEPDPAAPRWLLGHAGSGYRLAWPTEPAAAPPEDEPMVGRADEIASSTARLRGAPGLLSLVGPPGAGKTRLARHLAWRLATALPGGARFCDLTEATDLDGIVRALARAVELTLPGSTEASLQRLGHALAARGPTLLVLDNCEQALEAAGVAATRLRAAARELRIVATSREALGVAGEEVVGVGPLDHDAAIALFVTLARRERADFDAADPEQAEVVGRLVERLDRLPLALALAAGRIGALSPRHVLDRLDARFRLLQSRARDVDPRQRTLLAAVDWSWDLLTPDERATLAQAAAFRGGFDEAAARAVIAVDGDPVELLGRLVSRSLLQRRRGRYGGFLFVQEYAQRRLAEQPDLERATHLRHAAWYAGLRSGLSSDRYAPVLMPERDNLRVATERAIAAGRGDLAGAAGVGLLEVFKAEGPLEPLFALVERLLPLDGLRPVDRVVLQLRHVSVQLQTGLRDAEARVAEALALAEALGERGLAAGAHRIRGHLHRQQGRIEPAEADLTRAAELARAAADGDALAQALSSLGTFYRELGRYDRARARYDELVEVGEAYDLKAQRSDTYGNLAQLARREGRYDDARALCERSLACARELEDRYVEALALIGLGNLELETGAMSEARAAYERARALARRLGMRHTEGQILGNLVLVARTQGDRAGARAAAEQALEIFASTANRRAAAVALANLGELDLIEGDLDRAEPRLSAAVETLREVGDPVSEAEVLGPLAEVALARGDLAGARSHLARAEAEARRQGHPRMLAQTLARRGLLERARGEDARATLAEAEPLAEGAGPGSEVAALLDRLRRAIAGP